VVDEEPVFMSFEPGSMLDDDPDGELVSIDEPEEELPVDDDPAP
jgi:hypothetical protein